MSMYNLTHTTKTARFSENSVEYVENDILHPNDSTKILIRQNSALDCPLQVLKISFNCIGQNPVTIKPLIEMIMDISNHPYETAAEKAHYALLDSLSERHVCFYDNSRQGFVVNGRTISSGIPAKIIAKVLKEFKKSGQTEFTNSFFAEDESIVKHKLDKSFNINIKRAITNLENKAPSIELVRKTGSGIVQLNIKCDLSYSEK